MSQAVEQGPVTKRGWRFLESGRISWERRKVTLKGHLILALNHGSLLVRYLLLCVLGVYVFTCMSQHVYRSQKTTLGSWVLFTVVVWLHRAFTN